MQSDAIVFLIAVIEEKLDLVLGENSKYFES